MITINYNTKTNTIYINTKTKLDNGGIGSGDINMTQEELIKEIILEAYLLAEKYEISQIINNYEVNDEGIVEQKEGGEADLKDLLFFIESMGGLRGYVEESE